MKPVTQKHTPGGFKVDCGRVVAVKPPSWFKRSTEFRRSLYVVAQCRTYCNARGEEAEANARLFAAAPGLLDALKSALMLFDKDHALSHFDWGASNLRAEDIRELNELPRKIREAIAQATGEVR